MENQDGTFDVYVPRNLETTSSVTNHGAGLPTLKPLELRTYLKIGNKFFPFMYKYLSISKGHHSSFDLMLINHNSILNLINGTLKQL